LKVAGSTFQRQSNPSPASIWPVFSVMRTSIERPHEFGIVLVNRIHVPIHEIDQASPVAVFDRGRIPQP
jgi:hypothetical protein